MRCPKCGGKSWVCRTVASRDDGEEFVTRYRQCRDVECRFRWPTVEVHRVTGPDEHALDAGRGG